MRSWMIAFLTGSITFWLLPEFGVATRWRGFIYVSMALLLSGHAIFFYRANTREVARRGLLAPAKKHLIILAFIIGLVYPYLQYNLTRSQINLIPEYGQNLLVSGRIKTLRQTSDKFLSLTVSLDHMNHHPIGSIWRPQIKLNWYSPGQPPQPGERWQFVVRLKPIHGYANPHSFDYERWAWSNRIIANGYIIHSPRPVKLMYHFSFPERVIRYWQKKIKTTVNLSEQKHSNGVLNALLLGNKQQLSEPLYRSFQHSGLAHLFAISGLHIGMIAFFSIMLVQFLWKRSIVLCRFMPAQVAGLAAGLIAAFVYMELSGASVPTVRAFTMLGIFTLLKWSHLNWSLFQTLLTTALILVVLDPVIIISASAWLSFSAVLVIALLSGWQLSSSLWQKILIWGKLNLGIWLGMIPLSLLLFGGVAGFGFMANLIAIPMMTFWIMPTLLLGSMALLFNTDMALFIWQGTEMGIRMIIWLSHIFEKGYLPLPITPSLFYLLAILISGIIISRGLATRKLSLFVLVVVIINVLWLPNRMTGRRSARLITFDVGQGLAVLWEYPDAKGQTHRLMYDTAASNEDFIMGRTSWLPYFKEQGVDAIDTLVVSHKDNDHAGGLALFLKEIAVDKLYTSFPVSDHPASRCYSNLTVATSTDLTVHFLSPEKELYRYRDLATNNMSCVTEINWQKSTILLPGDIEAFIEKRLLDKQRLPIVDVLIAPHHGSLTSSTMDFVHQLNSRVVIFSTGYNNPFQFPRPMVVERYKSTGSRLYNTAMDGAISCQWDLQGHFAGCKTERENYWGKWHWMTPENARGKDNDS